MKTETQILLGLHAAATIIIAVIAVEKFLDAL